jgi:hypothetical protein
VLTDFEEIHLYVVGSKPFPEETGVGLWKHWHFGQYPLVAREIWDLLSRPAVAGGALERAIEALPRKRRILTANIFGVDLDAGAVEVTQLSLYLKMLEGENRTTLAAERDLFGSDIALLPPLQDNIKCGNSLIASDFSIIPEDLVRVRAFDWDVQFAAIMKNGGFDAVVGNPPYIRIQVFPQDQVGHFVRVFGAATGNYDVYVNFVERGFNLLGPKGRLGMILPNKFFRTDYGLGLRRCLSTVSGPASRKRTDLCIHPPDSARQTMSHGEWRFYDYFGL